MGRPQSPKLFQMDVEISTLIKSVGAYTIKHLPTGKMYHGSTKDLYRRVVEHQGDLRRGNHGNCNLQELHNAGGELKLTFFPMLSQEEALKKEQELINNTHEEVLLNRSYDAVNTAAGMWKNPDLKDQLSKARLGNTNASGMAHTEEWKEKKAAEMKGNAHRLGHRHNDESRKQMSETRKGRVCSPDHVANSAEGRTRERVVIGDITYQNAAAAGAAIGMSSDGVKKRCRSDKFPEYKLVPKV